MQALITALFSGLQAAHVARGSGGIAADAGKVADAFLDGFVSSIPTGKPPLPEAPLDRLNATEQKWLQQHALHFVQTPDGYLLCSLSNTGPAILGRDLGEMVREYRHMMGMPSPGQEFDTDPKDVEFTTSIAGLAPDHIANVTISDNLPVLLTLKRIVGMKNFRPTKNTAAMARPVWIKFNDLAKLKDDPQFGLIRDYVVTEIRPLCFAALGKKT
jgi:hypothetical protein